MGISGTAALYHIIRMKGMPKLGAKGAIVATPQPVASMATVQCLHLLENSNGKFENRHRFNKRAPDPGLAALLI